MREILFRGKMKYLNLPHKKGDWVYGNYVEFNDGDRTIHCIYGYGDVIPETVGQYTGLTDKNGVKIFEGDICKFSYPVINGYCTGVVNYFLGSFVVDSDFENLEFSLEQLVIEDEEFNVEVIANIHDNPELLEAERNDGNGS